MYVEEAIKSNQILVISSSKMLSRDQIRTSAESRSDKIVRAFCLW